MASLDSLIRHAITPPTFDKTKLHRERLVDAIHANVPRKLIAIAAPPGYGKTMLLANFHAFTDLPVCWIRLTEADRDLMRLAKVLMASLGRRFRRLYNLLEIEKLAGSSPEAIARAFVGAIDERVGETFVIAIDDVHYINRSKPVLAFLDALLEMLPDQVTVIAAGREVLEVSLAKLMAEGNLAGMGPHDLALTHQEILSLAKKQLNLELTQQAAARLLQETRGWITGVLLSGSLSESSLSAIMQSSRPVVYEYLASVVLNRQPDDLRRFMLDSSVFHVMTAEACDCVLEQESSSRLLTRLVRRGLFVTATMDSPRTYEYHPQFRQFLLELLQSADPRRLNSLRVRAANYLAEQGVIEQAVALYLDAGAIGSASTLAERHAQEMLRAGRRQTLEVWATRFREAEAAAPKVFLYVAKAYTDQGRLEEAEECLDYAFDMMKKSAPKDLRASIINQQGLIALRKGEYERTLEAAEQASELIANRGSPSRKAEILRLRALAIFRGGGNLQEAEQLARDAVNLMEGKADPYDLAVALADLSTIQTALGEPIEAHRTGLKAYEIWKEIGAPYAIATALNNLAVDSHLQGHFEEAMRLFAEALKNARQAGSIHRETIILLGQADLFNDLGMAIQSAELYGQALNLATRLDNVELLSYGCIQTSVLHRRRGGVGLAHEWLGRAISLREEADPTPNIRIQLANLATFASPSHAEDQLLDILERKRVPLDASEETLALLFLARARLHQGELVAAMEALERAFNWAGGHGTEQFLAAELMMDEECRDFAKQRLRTSSILTVILQRIETMRAVAQQYQDEPDEGKEAARVELIALGKVEIRYNENRITELKPRAQEVLFFLADHERVSRDVLLETFWSNYSPGRQVSNLHSTMYSLRRALGKEVIIHEGMIYGVNPDIPIDYDVPRFERAARIAEHLPLGDPRRMFALTEAINSYGGQYLPEFSSDWLIERRRAMELRYLDLLANHAEEALLRDQPMRAVATLRQALSIDPYRDDTNLQMLEALGRLGRRSEIVAHYQRYVRLLQNDLGLDPPEPVREAYSRLIT